MSEWQGRRCEQCAIQLHRIMALEDSVKQLAAENVELKERWEKALSEAREAAGHEFGLWPLGAAAITHQLRKENAALREDKARLDAVEAQCPEGFDWSITWLDSGGWKIHPLRKEFVGDCTKPYRHFSTSRAAIDAARKEAR